MSLGQLLDRRLIGLLQRRLVAGLAGTPASGLLSITLDLGQGGDDWLGVDLTRNHVNWWARAPTSGSGECRLAIGRAMSFCTAGAARFPALQAAFAGLSAVWRHDDQARTDVQPLAHVGFAFAPESVDQWPNARLLVPAILLQNRGGRRTATFSCVGAEAEGAVKRWLGELQAASRPLDDSPPASALRRRANVLAEQVFLARARAALADIAGGKLDKLVLARSLNIDADETIAVAPLLALLLRRYPECTIYGVGHQGQGLFGATPERLVALRGDRVQADALAGTAWLGAAATDQPGSLTLQDGKNRREQQLVVDAVHAALVPLCASLALPQAAEVMQLRGLQHLRTTVCGRLRQGVGFFDLLAALHPTPAVGGWPAAVAGEWLQAHGEQRGAWYSGGLGWVDRCGDGEAVVVLRCARIERARAELFAGAGIVAGSQPAQELAETEAKLAVIADALQHARYARPPLAGRTGTR